jgi:hypothetical protein
MFQLERRANFDIWSEGDIVGVQSYEVPRNEYERDCCIVAMQYTNIEALLWLELAGTDRGIVN